MSSHSTCKSQNENGYQRQGVELTISGQIHTFKRNSELLIRAVAGLVKFVYVSRIRDHVIPLIGMNWTRFTL